MVTKRMPPSPVYIYMFIQFISPHLNFHASSKQYNASCEHTKKTIICYFLIVVTRSSFFFFFFEMQYNMATILMWCATRRQWYNCWKVKMICILSAVALFIYFIHKCKDDIVRWFGHHFLQIQHVKPYGWI